MTHLTEQPNAAQIIHLFNRCFKHTERTLLVGAGNEPLYLPQTKSTDYAQVIFTHDYIASALHEIAHWCIAGKVRRQQEDYGYWYAPEGRDQQQQQLFYQFEVKPQALEWIFSDSCKHTFYISCDHFLDDLQAQQDKQHFTQQVQQQKLQYLTKGLPERAKLFNQALIAYYT